MIVINKDLEVNEVIFDTIISTGELCLHSDFTGKDYVIELDTNYSPYSRYSLFEISDYSAIETGNYLYKLMNDDEVKESGHLRVISSGSTVNSLPAFITNPSNDDLKIFKIDGE